MPLPGGSDDDDSEEGGSSGGNSRALSLRDTSHNMLTPHSTDQFAVGQLLNFG